MMFLKTLYDDIYISICHYLVHAERGSKHVNDFYFIISTALSFAMFQAIYAFILIVLFNIPLPTYNSEVWGVLGILTLAGLNVLTAVRSNQLRNAVRSLVSNDVESIASKSLRTFKLIFAGIPVLIGMVIIVK